MKIDWQELPQKKWFSPTLITILIIVNWVSYTLVKDYFEVLTPGLDSIKEEQSLLGTGNQIVDWAKQILRFFKNP